MQDADENFAAEYENYVSKEVGTHAEKALNVFQEQVDGGSGAWSTENKLIIDSFTLKSLYFNEDWVYILVDRYASKISSQRLLVGKEQSYDGKLTFTPEARHPFQARIDQPNALQDYHTWMYSLVTDLVLMGNSIQWTGAVSGQIMGIPAEAVRMDFTDRNTLRSYQIQQSNTEDPYAKVASFRPEEITHVRRPNPSSYWWGLSPFIPGRASVAFNRYSLEYLNNFYIKGAQPGIILEMDKEANEKVVLRLLKSFELAYQGRRNQRRTVVLPRGVTAKQHSHSLADQQLRDYMVLNRETITNLLQVPKHELSIAETGSLGSEEYKIALKNFWGGPLKSTMRLIEGALSKSFKQELGPGYVLKFDLSDLEVLAENEETKADLAIKLKSMLTLNEVRAKIYKLPPLPGGDALPQGSAPPIFAPQQAFSAPPIEVKNVDEAAAARARNLARFTANTKADGSAPDWWQERDKIQTEANAVAIPKMVENALDMFLDQATGIIAAIKSSTVNKAADIPSRATLRKRVRDALNELEDKWVRNYVDTLEATVELGYNTSLKLPFNLPNESEIQALKERGTRERRLILEERGLKSFELMSKTTTEEVMKRVTDGVSESKTIQEITKDIANIFANPEAMTARAERIARTEVLTAQSIGQAASMQDAATVIPNLKKVWIAAGDERVRGNPGGLYPNSKSDHWTLSGQVRDHDQPFIDSRSGAKMDYPRDASGGPGDTINCRCVMIMVPGDEADRMGLEDLATEFQGG